MNLAEIFAHLEQGDLSQLAQGGRLNGGIYPRHAESVTRAVELALTALHTRFVLRQDEVLLEQQVGLNRYPIRPEYAESNSDSTEPVRFLKDAAGPVFVGGVLKLEQVFDEMGVEWLINNRGSGLYTPSFDVLQIAEVETGRQLSILYRADHPPLNYDCSQKPDTVDVDLPHYLMEPLLSYAAYRVYQSMGGQDDVALAQAKLAQYEAQCARVVESGLVQEEQEWNEKLEINGWA